MKSIYWDKDNKALYINKTFFSWKPIKTLVKAHKGVDSEYSVNLHFLWWDFEYTDYNYSPVIHVILKSTDKYSHTDDADGIAHLQIALKSFANPDALGVRQNPPFSYAVEYNGEDDKGEELYTYYITAPANWFKTHGCSVLTDALMREVINHNDLIDNEKKFPKYNKYKTEVVYL